jgi:NitT/TauT family transport system substrate-binding protein
MPSRRKVLLASATLPALFSGLGRATGFPVLRLGVLPFGTVLWEAETIRREGLDTLNGFALETVKLASSEAARIAFQAGRVDAIVSDLLWAARLRNDGRTVKFLPFSSTEGAVMVPAASSITGAKDLVGKTIGVAGGSLDKSWILLRAYALQNAAIDLAVQATPAYGAPPLLAQKLEAGELDAALLYWNFCARLEAKGHRRLISVGEIGRSFGLAGDLALLGYVLDDKLLERDRRLPDALARASQQAKRILETQDAAWIAVRPLMEAPDEPTFTSLRRSFLDGVPRRSIQDERADAEKLYHILVVFGGERLVGPHRSLPSGLYWGDEQEG